MRLDELLDKVYPYEQVIDTPERSTYKFITPDELLVIVNIGLYQGESSSTVILEFDVEKSHFWKPTTNLISIFSTVAAIANEYIENNPNFDALEFSASMNRPSLVKLYDRLAKKVSAKLPDAKLEIKQNPGFKNYRWVR